MINYIFLFLYIVFFVKMMTIIYGIYKKSFFSCMVVLEIIFIFCPDFLLFDYFHLNLNSLFMIFFTVILPFIYIVGQKKILVYLKSNIAQILMYIICLASILFVFISSNNCEYSIQKFVLITLKILIPTVLLISNISQFKEVDDLFNTLLYAILLFCLKYYYICGFFGFRSTFEAMRLDTYMSNLIWISRIDCLGIIIFIKKILKNEKVFIFDFLSLFLLTTQVLFLSSRGPMLSLAIAMCIVIIINLNINNVIKYLKYTPLIILLLFISYKLFQFIAASGSINYFLYKLTSFGKNGSDAGRIQFMTLSLERFKESPLFGVGIGLFQKDYSFASELARYPHNIILEILCEFGLIGITTFTIFILKIISKIKKVPNFLICLFTFYFVNSLLSGDIVGNLEVFVIGTLIISYNYFSCREYSVN
ncbi:Lipid A core-O-antigen ligase and related enzymes [uncultured Clostridium sp.]|nr:Lipid A core-O-antigen ligase and related enzymes [uncultured Clostridium sp.]